MIAGSLIISDALRYEVSEYLKNINLDNAIKHNPELQILIDPKTVIDGAITTNWDLLLEKIFPTFKVFVGESTLLFSNPQAIAEIYKIHGCCSNMNSLVLTKSDYEVFEKKNYYLAAKLLSIFLEHPVIFIGYSFSDSNIELILKSISEMMDTDERVQKLGKNLIFLSRANGVVETINHTFHTFESGARVPITRVVTDDFSKIYKALQQRERQIPSHILRLFKEQLYSIVQSSEPEKKVHVVDIDDIVSGDSEIQFVAGIGVADKHKYGEKGLNGITDEDIFRSVIFDDMRFNKADVLKRSISDLAKSRTYLPIKKFIKEEPSWRPKQMSKKTEKLFDADVSFFINKIPQNYHKSFDHNLDIDQLLDREDIKKILGLNYLALYFQKNIEALSEESIKKVHDFISTNFDSLFYANCKTEFRRLICIYDSIVNK